MRGNYHSKLRSGEFERTSQTWDKDASAMKAQWRNETFNRSLVSEYSFQRIARGIQDSP